MWLFSHLLIMKLTHLPLVPHIYRSIGSALVQVLACRLFSMLNYCQLDPGEQISMKFERKYKLFIHENAFENAVCEMAAICSGEYELIKRFLQYQGRNTETLQWCHMSLMTSHQWPFDCLFNGLFRITSKKHLSLHYWPIVNGIHLWIPCTKGQ